MTAAPPVPSAPPADAQLYVPALQACLPLVISVPEAGRLARMPRSRAYLAAQEGTIPTLRVGQRLKVPTARWLAQLGLDCEAVQR